MCSHLLEAGWRGTVTTPEVLFEDTMQGIVLRSAARLAIGYAQ
jgi:hypothetical protein